MISILPALRALAITGLAGLVLGGCSASSVAFTNVSDSWLNVRFFVGQQDKEASRTGEFLSDARLQVRPGETVKYALTSNRNYDPEVHTVVHLHVQPVTPSWQPTAADYWLELLTPPPVTIVATGPSDTLTFNTGEGAVAVIPEREIQKGRFDHKMVSAPESDAPSPD